MQTQLFSIQSTNQVVVWLCQMVLELWPTACKYKNMEKNWEIFFVIIIILNDIQGHDWDLWK